MLFRTLHFYGMLPDGLYEDRRLHGKCIHLLRNLYGSAEAPRLFHDLSHNWFISEGFEVNPHEPCLYFKWIKNVPLFCLVHTDDILTVSTPEIIVEHKARLKKVFNLKEVGELGKGAEPSLYLGMEIVRTPTEFQLRQTKLIDMLTSKCGNLLSSIPHEKVPMRDIRLDDTSCPDTPELKAKWKLKAYRSLLGVCGYLMLATRNDISFAYQRLARWNDNYGQDHCDALLRLVKFLEKSKQTHYLSISKFGGWNLSGYCDSDFNGCPVMHMSSTGWIIFLGWVPISWCSRLQRCVARSTGEAEYLALSSLSQEAVYLSMFARSLKIPESVFEIYSNESNEHDTNGTDPSAVQIWSDSQVALAQAKKPDNWVVDKLRHIKTAYHFFKSYVRNGALRLLGISGKDNPSDIYTKGWGAPGKTAANQKADDFKRHADFCAGRR